MKMLKQRSLSSFAKNKNAIHRLKLTSWCSRSLWGLIRATISASTPCLAQRRGHPTKVHEEEEKEGVYPQTCLWGCKGWNRLLFGSTTSEPSLRRFESFKIGFTRCCVMPHKSEWSSNTATRYLSEGSSLRFVVDHIFFSETAVTVL